jgi:hypothetical protein
LHFVGYVFGVFGMANRGSDLYISILPLGDRGVLKERRKPNRVRFKDTEVKGMEEPQDNGKPFLRPKREEHQVDFRNKANEALLRWFQWNGHPSSDDASVSVIVSL